MAPQVNAVNLGEVLRRAIAERIGVEEEYEPRKDTLARLVEIRDKSIKIIEYEKKRLANFNELIELIKNHPEVSAFCDLMDETHDMKADVDDAN